MPSSRPTSRQCSRSLHSFEKFISLRFDNSDSYCMTRLSEKKFGFLNKFEIKKLIKLEFLY